MVRRSDHSRDEIREMALSATEAIIGEQGYASLSARKTDTTEGRVSARVLTTPAFRR